MEITIRDLWTVLKKSLIMVVICAVLFGVVAYVYVANFVQKEYTSSTDYVLFPVRGDDDQEMTVPQLNNALVVGSKSLNALSSYLMTERTMEDLLRYMDQMHDIDPDNVDYVLDHEYTVEQLLSFFTFKKPQDDYDIVFSVSCKAHSPHDSRVLLSAFSAIINERSVSILNGVFVIAECDPPLDGTMTAPHPWRVALIALVLGAMIPYVIVLTATVLDTRIKKDEDIKNNFNYPLLGQIPHF